MADYKYVTYETFDDGTIARIMLDRVESRNAQNRGLLVELETSCQDGSAACTQSTARAECSGMEAAATPHLPY